MEKEKAGAAAAGKEEKRKKKKILDLLRDRGKVPGLFLRPTIKQLFNYRSKTDEKPPKQSRGRIVRGKALKRNTRRYRRDIQYHSEGIEDYTREKHAIQTGEKHPAPVFPIHAARARGRE